MKYLKLYEQVFENKDSMEYIGNFLIESGQVIVSDPGYDMTDGGILNNIVNGKWNSYINKKNIESWGTRVSSLFAVHQDYKINEIKNWKKANFSVNVDSGQAGIYDLKYYGDGNSVKGPFLYKDIFPIFSPIYHTKLQMHALKNIREEEKKIGREYSKDEFDRRYLDLKHKFKEIFPQKYEVIEEVWGNDGDNLRDQWYNANCVQTIGYKNKIGKCRGNELILKFGGCLKYGCVSRAGIGDGTYSCYYATETNDRVLNDDDPFGEENWDDSPIISIKIVYL